MPRDKLRAVLKLAARRPVSCVVVLTKDRQAVVLLDKRLKPRKLAAKLKSEAKAAGLTLDLPTVRFGRASVDGGSDSARVVFTVHKDAPAVMSRAVLPLLRPVGFQRAEFVTDGGLETEPEEGDDGQAGDDGGETGGDGAATGSAGADAAVAAGAGQDVPSQLPAPGAAPSSPPSTAAVPAAPSSAAAAPADGNGAAGNGAAAPRSSLAEVVPPDLARAIQAAVTADPSRKPVLARLLAQVRAGMDGDDPQAAEAGIAALRQAVNGPATPPAGLDNQKTVTKSQTVGAGQLPPPVQAPAIPTTAPPPLQANAKLADLARAWEAEQAKAGQGGSKAPAPLASKRGTAPDPSGPAALLSGQQDRTAGLAPPDAGSATPAKAFLAPPAALPPAEPAPGPPPGVRPPIQVPPAPPPPGGTGAGPLAARGVAAAEGAGAAGGLGTLLLGLGAGLVVMFWPSSAGHDDGQDQGVTGHPGLAGRMEKQGPSTQGTVEISIPGQGGVVQSLGKLTVDAVNGWAVFDPAQRGTVLGHVDTQAATITLTPVGEAWLAEQVRRSGVPMTFAESGNAGGVLGHISKPQSTKPPDAQTDAAAPQPGTPSPADAAAPPRPGTPGLPQTPPPGQQPQRPAWLEEVEGIETRDDDEREFIERQAQGGMKHADIVRALDERRRGNGTAPGGTPPVGVLRPPVSASPEGPPGSPYPGPDMTPMDSRERALVKGLKEKSASDEEIAKALAESRAEYGPADLARRRKQARNAGLPDELTTDFNRAKQNAYDADEKLRKALNDKAISWEDFAAHHLIPVEVVRKWKELFEAAARAGWSTDESDNVVALPKTEGARERMERHMGERRALHDNPHRNWNTEAKTRMRELMEELKGLGLPPGPDYDQAVRRRLEEMQRKLRDDMACDRLTMGDAPMAEAA